MALSATICKANIQITDMDRSYYASHALTIAMHPSENEARMMARLLLFIVYASEQLKFSKGLSDVEEPDIWEKDYSDNIALWMDVGQPDDTRMRKASNRADHVVVLTYTSSSEVWWKKIENKVSGLSKLTVLQLKAGDTEALSALAARNMQIQVTIQDGEIWFSTDTGELHLRLITLKAAA